jgi:hypothetical protein
LPETFKPAWVELNSGIAFDQVTRRENEQERIEFAGPGAELLRRIQVGHLRAHMDLFYEHGSLTDLSALCAAFELLERGWEEPAGCHRYQASFVEAFLGAFGFSAKDLLASKLQMRPDWPR